MKQKPKPKKAGTVSTPSPSGSSSAATRPTSVEPADDNEFSIILNPIVAQLLAVLGNGDPCTTIMKLIDHAQQGVYRPGSWERQWLYQAFGFDWQNHLVPGNPYAPGSGTGIFQKPKP